MHVSMKSGTKIFFLFLIFSIFPFLITFLIYDYSSLKTTASNVRNLATQLVSQKAEKINERLSYIESLQRSSIDDESMLDLLNNYENEEPIEKALQMTEIKEYFNAIIYSDKFVKSIIINLPNGETLSFGRGTYSGYVDKDIKRLSRIEFTSKLLKNTPFEPEWKANEIDQGKNIYLVRPVHYFAYAKTIGIITFVIDKDEIFDDAIQIKNGESAIVENESAVYGNRQLTKAFNTNPTTVHSGKLYISKKLESDWKLIVAIDEKKMLQPITSARAIMLVVIAAGILVSIALARIIAYSIQKNVNILKSNFGQLEKADFSIGKKITSNDEFSEIESHQIKMANNLDKLIKQNYQNELITKDAIIRSLEYQVSPHFLYNTLEIINSLALENRTDEIRVVTQSLAGLFRYNLTASSLVLLSTELKQSQEYINIEKYQLNYELDVFFEINVDHENIQVVKFLIQPLIENSIKHGFYGRTSPALIEVHVTEKNGVISIVVIDDGQGMSETELNQLKEKIRSETDIEGIGLRNIYRRLQTIFEDKFEMNIESVVGMGTTVLVKFPLTLEESK